MDLLNLAAPHGSGWELLAAVLVVIIGPVLVERVGVPGMVGLLAGGWMIGTNGFGIVPAEGGIVHELGDIGLLYLMFMAGLELDLALFRDNRVQAMVFAVLSFALPQGLGLAFALMLGYDALAAVLLGSLFASHTLITYPIVRRMGLATNRAVAVAVGATVVTDTIALVVLAVVSGSATGSGGGGELVVQILLGLAVLGAWCFAVLPRVAAWFFTGVGQERTIRYMFLVAAFLSASVLAESVGIESIVGAFFAGLALNRFVPNESAFMHRVEFFGSAMFIPFFLVSVGTIIEPRVMADLGTIGLAAVFVAACLGGKLVAALAGRPLFGFSGPEAHVVFALTTPQAAATLAATFVGLQIGLLTTGDVNAVMLLIVVSLLVSSVVVGRSGPRVPRAPVDRSRLGRSIVFPASPDDIGPLASVAARLARADVGVLHPTVVVADGDRPPDDDVLEEIEAECTALGVDVDVTVRYDRTATDGVVHAAAGQQASLVVASSPPETWLPTPIGSPLHELVAAVESPVVVVRPGAGYGKPTRVVLVLAAAHLRNPGSATLLAASVAERLAKTDVPLVVVAADETAAREIVSGAPEDTEFVTDSASDYVRDAVGETDIVVVPGGRNGSISTARVSRLAGALGATLLAVADRRSVSPLDRAGQGLGVVGFNAPVH
jgi:Kef-type K+ transport system membrane component KefB